MAKGPENTFKEVQIVSVGAQVKGEIEMDKIIIVVWGFVVWAICIPLHGFTIRTMWIWFVEPTYQIPAPTIVNAAGIAMLVSFMTIKIDRYDRDDRDQMSQAAYKSIISIVLPFFLLGFGWIVHLFA